MKKVVSVGYFWIVTLLSFSGFSQLLSGRVVDAQNQSLQGVSIRAYLPKSSIIQAFAITNTKGFYQFNKIISSDSVRLVVGAMGFAIEERIISKMNLVQDFVLTPKATELQEVKVKIPPIRVSNDTIRYDVKQFANSSDRNLADILKKLPGIELGENGVIKYNGEPINKYYTEGKDLFEGKYKIANDNFKWQDVERVEILENHQPINLLRDIVYSQKAGLNVVFKESAKAQWLKNAQLGVGLNTDNLLYDNLLNLARITPKNQSFSIFKNNNIGSDLSPDTKELNIEQLINSGPQLAYLRNTQPITSIAELSRPPIQQKYLTFNQSHFITSKHLWGIGKKYDLVLNLEYLKDKQNNQGQIESRYFLGKDTLVVSEKKNNNFRLDQLEGTLSLVSNQPKYYLSNKLSVKNSWKYSEGILINESNNLSQTLLQNSPFETQWLSNDFKLLKKTFSNNVFEIRAWGYFIKAPQALSISGDKSIVEQNITTEKGLFDTYISFMTHKKLGLNIKLGITYSTQKLDSKLEGFMAKTLVADSALLAQNQRINYMKIYGEIGYSLSKENIKLEAKLPVSFLYWQNPQKEQLFFEPKISATYIFSSQWNTSARYDFSNYIPEINEVYTGYLLNDYRTITQNNGVLPTIQKHTANWDMRFRDMVHFWLASIGIGWQKSQLNLLKGQNNERLFIKQINLASDNTTESLIAFAQISKYWHSIRTKITLNGTNENRLLSRLLTNNQLALIKNQSQNLTCNIATSPKNWIQTQFEVKFSQNRNIIERIGGNTDNKFKQMDLVFKINANPSKLLTLGFEVSNSQITDDKNTKQSYVFMDASTRYKFKNSSWQIGLNLQNIANESSFRSFSFSENSYFLSTFRIRPRQLILSANFSF